jgi:glycosyltransferase
MHLTLITVTFNACASLEETILSVQQQHYKNLEYLIVDGGSTDGTLEMVKKYAEVVTSFVSEPDKGIYDAMNKGLKRATGDVIGFLHADDRFAHPLVLNDIMAAFETKPSDALYGDLQYVTSFEPLKVLRHWKSGAFNRQLISKGWMPPHPTVYFKRSLLKQIGYFDTSYKIAADYDWLLRLLLVEDVSVDYLPEVLVYMSTGGASNKSIGNIIQKSKEDYRAIRQNKVGGLMTLVNKNLGKVGQFLSHE